VTTNTENPGAPPPPVTRLETAFLPKRRRNVYPSELSCAEPALELLDDFECMNDPSLAEQYIDTCAMQWLIDEHLSDPMECFAAYLLRTVICGRDCDWMNGPIDGALPMLAEQFRGQFSERVFAVAESPPPWPRCDA
jgi:hypothetical protein